MPNITLPTVQVSDKGEMGRRKVKALVLAVLKKQGRQPAKGVDISSISWNLSPEKTRRGDEIHQNVTVNYIEKV